VFAVASRRHAIRVHTIRPRGVHRQQTFVHYFTQFLPHVRNSA